jgi:nicotinamide riboside transporter PnuC
MNRLQHYLIYFNFTQFRLYSNNFSDLEGAYVFDGLNTPRTLDAANNGISIMAQMLLVTRYWECWLLWQTSNAIQITMFTGKWRLDQSLTYSMTQGFYSCPWDGGFDDTHLQQ